MIDLPRPSDPAEATSVPTTEALPRAHPVLNTGRRRALFESLLALDERLRDRDSRMARMYLGALVARAQRDNLEYLVHAAHSLRELMEKMPRYHKVPIARAEGLSLKVRSLVSAWKARQEAEGAAARAEQDARFEGEMQEFAMWFQQRDTPRKEQAGQLMGKMDQREMRLPKSIERLRLAEWDDYDGFFQGVSHHTRETVPDEFDSYVAGFEEFLLSYLKPATYEDREKLREELARLEANGRA